MGVGMPLPLIHLLRLIDLVPVYINMSLGRDAGHCHKLASDSNCFFFIGKKMIGGAAEAPC